MILGLADFIIFGVLVAGGVVVVMLGVTGLTKRVTRSLFTIRTNDLHHIDCKLDDITAGVGRVEQKLDAHLTDHREGRM